MEIDNKRPTILFIASPNENSEILNSKRFEEEFSILHHQLTTKESFLNFLKDHANDNIVAIYGGYPAFHPIGGLTHDIIEHELFPRKQLKCIVLCSRGYNGIDLDALRRNKIQLYNYQDDDDEEGEYLINFAKSQVGNDVADCVMWHVLEGFRKFSFQQKILREDGNTLIARNHVAKKEKGFAFGHELSNDKTSFVESPRGKKCLILGLGSIGKQIAYKLHHGLGMEIHYCKKSEDFDLTKTYNWKFHRLDQTLNDKLYQFQAIIVALPGTKATEHLIDEEFLSHCNGPSLTLINVGRGSILNMDHIEKALQSGQLRHLGLDVFYNEPIIDDLLLTLDERVTVTPHIGSSTKQVYYQSCESALANIIKATDGSNHDSLSRAV